MDKEQIKKIAEIVVEIWYSGKNDSQVFDFHECNLRQRWVARLVSLFPNPDEVKLPQVVGKGGEANDEPEEGPIFLGTNGQWKMRDEVKPEEMAWDIECSDYLKEVERLDKEIRPLGGRVRNFTFNK